MRVMVTGAAGFIGRLLTAKLLDGVRLADEQGGYRAIDEIVLVDRDFPQKAPLRTAGGVRVVHLTGDLADAGFVDEVASSAISEMERVVRRSMSFARATLFSRAHWCGGKFVDFLNSRAKCAVDSPQAALSASSVTLSWSRTESIAFASFR